jgi:hypothetical protein
MRAFKFLLCAVLAPLLAVSITGTAEARSGGSSGHAPAAKSHSTAPVKAPAGSVRAHCYMAVSGISRISRRSIRNSGTALGATRAYRSRTCRR